LELHSRGHLWIVQSDVHGQRCLDDLYGACFPAVRWQGNHYASSVTDSTKSASATVIIPGTASKATLKGQYVFFITAPTGNRKAPAGIWGTTTFVGSVTVDGAGNITGGVDDMASPAFSDTADQILPTTANLIPKRPITRLTPVGAHHEDQNSEQRNP